MKHILIMTALLLLLSPLVSAAYYDFLDTNAVNATFNVSVGTGTNTIILNGTSGVIDANSNNFLNPHEFAYTHISCELGTCLEVDGGSVFTGDFSLLSGDFLFNGDLTQNGVGVTTNLKTLVVEQGITSDTYINASKICDEDDGICLDEIIAGGGGNPFDQSLNTTDNVTFYDVALNGTLGIGVSPNPNYKIYIKDYNVDAGLNSMLFDIRQNVSLFAPLSFTNKLIRTTGNPVARTLEGTVSTTKDLSGTQTMTVAYMNAGINGDTAQTQGIRIIEGVHIMMDNPGIMSGGTINQYGVYYDGVQDFQSGGTINEYGAYIKKAGDIDFGTGVNNHYGVYLTGWTKGATEDVSYSLYVNDGEVYINDEITVTDLNTGGNAGTGLCVDANNKLCICGSCA
jgi:hypothetical protein